LRRFDPTAQPCGDSTLSRHFAFCPILEVSVTRVLITGGAGKVAALLRSRLARPGRTLRLFDLREPPPLAAPPPGGEAEEIVLGSLDDPDAVAAACEGVAAVIHLGGLAKEATPADVLRVNAFGTWCVLEGARRAGARVILASSAHATGFADLRAAPPGGLPADTPPRPDTAYGWSKVAGEAAGRLFADRFGMDVICLRIGMWVGAPPDPRGLWVWLSPDDGARLVEAAMSAPAPGFRIVWGVSRNTRGRCSLAEGEAIGYFPEDDAEHYAAELIARHGEPGFDDDPALYHLGGPWCEIPLGRPPANQPATPA
jgi:uronate dehydrogenase